MKHIGVLVICLFVDNVMTFGDDHSPTPIQIVTRRNDALNKHDLDLFLSTYADDVSVSVFPSRLLGQGKSHLRKIFGPMIKRRDVHVEVKSRIESDSYVVIESNTTFGNQVETSVAVYEVRNGLIQRVQFLRDTIQARQIATPQFQKLVLTDRYYCDGIATGDIDGDGHLDIVAGPFWYEGPEFEESHEFYEAVPLPPEESPSNSMFSFVHDFNHDDRLDILVLGRVHKHAAYWYENPGATDDLWERHYVFERIRGESPTLVDLDGDGVPQLLTHWEGAWGYLEPTPEKPTAPWLFHPLGENEDWPQFYHGQGVGDLNNDGRLDYVINDGWYEQPKDRDELWTFHRVRFSLDRGGAQIGVMDVDGDGDDDVISAIHAHEWGLAWFENLGNAVRFEEHLIMSDRTRENEFGVAFSQPHALEFADINGDGLIDIVTGKRMWAHGPTGDVEPMAAPVVYWFELTRENSGNVRYVPHLVDDHSGVGVQIRAEDVNADGRVDILTTSKIGTFLFLSNVAHSGHQ